MPISILTTQPRQNQKNI